MSNIFGFFLAQVYVFFISFISKFGMDRVVLHEWYDHLQKPFFTPNPKIFAFVWPVLYFLIGLSCYLFFKENFLKKRFLFLIHFIHMFLNASWTYVFFLHRNIFGGVVVIAFMITTLLLFIFYAVKKDATSIIPLIPYCFWIFYAFYLNVELWRLN